MGYPKRWRLALDFGCGVGRVTRALASHFEECYGVDISAKMLEKARQINQDIANCRFLLNNQPDLRIFPDQYFDLVYCKLVLQHFPTRKLIEEHIAEFCRTLGLGGLLVFQLPSWIPLRHRLQPRRRGYHLLHGLGVDKKVLFRLGLHPIRMTFVRESEIRSFLERVSVDILDVRSDGFAGPRDPSKTYYVTKGR
jgi:SAM-dependent methyltransferase